MLSMVISVLKQMNERYHRCVSVCKHIQQRLGITMQNALTPQVVIATADKLIYNYAIEMVSYEWIWSIAVAEVKHFIIIYYSFVQSEMHCK